MNGEDLGSFFSPSFSFLDPAKNLFNNSSFLVFCAGLAADLGASDLGASFCSGLGLESSNP
ncbi:MAG: hypothetical protein AABX05_00820, partial [Nanoarchaeota archaeon]